MNFCIKDHFFTKEILKIYFQSNMKIMVRFKADCLVANDYIELTAEELTRMNKCFIGIPETSDQVKPDGS